MSFKELIEDIEIVKPLENVESKKESTPKSFNIQSPYEENKIYHTTVSIMIRVRPRGEGKRLEEVDFCDRRQAYANMDDKAVLRKGAAITCRGLEMKGSELWMKIDSGYICARKGSIVYIA